MPGSGKSTLGQALAAALVRPLVDLDEIIEVSVGKTVKQIFAEDGEAAFRQYERESLETVLAQSAPYVLATGGGTPCFYDSAERMNAAGMSIFLDTPLEELLVRLHNSDEQRPLLAEHQQDAGALRARVEQLLDLRRPFYMKAHIHLRGDNLQLSHVLEKLAAPED
jgi:shikimate kinase